jgi:glutathione S-transferase
MSVELFQFRYSPYNEKVRWALDLKRIAHRRIDLMPGPHMGRVRRLSGQTATPVLTVDGRVIAGSSAILRELDRLSPAPALSTANPEVIAMEDRFDNDIGPRIRRKVLSMLLGDLGYFSRLFGEGQPPAKRIMYRMVLPLVQGLVRRGNGITGPESIEDGERAVWEGLALVAERSRPTGYLVGGTFSAADLTAASILATVVNPPDSTMTRPQPMPATFANWIESVQAHPGAQWVRAIYTRHRSAQAVD